MINLEVSYLENESIIAGMNIYEIRKNNLRFIIDSIFQGKQAELTKALGKNQSTISRIFTSTGSGRNIGDTLAREIEAAANKPKFWLDQVHDSNLSHDVDDKLLSEILEAVLNVYKEKGLEHDPLEQAKLISKIYVNIKKKPKNKNIMREFIEMLLEH